MKSHSWHDEDFATGNHLDPFQINDNITIHLKTNVTHEFSLHIFDHILIGVTIGEEITGHTINTLNDISSFRWRQDKITICFTPATMQLFLWRFQLDLQGLYQKGTFDLIKSSFLLSCHMCLLFHNFLDFFFCVKSLPICVIFFTLCCF